MIRARTTVSRWLAAGLAGAVLLAGCSSTAGSTDTSSAGSSTGGTTSASSSTGTSSTGSSSSSSGSTSTSSSTSSSSTAKVPFVTASGTSFMVGGAPFRFVGVNIYDAAATDAYSCDPGAKMSPEQLASTMKTLHDKYGATVVRFWAYQTYTRSGQDFSGVDNVIAAAKAAGMYVLPVLEDGPGYCTTMDTVVPKAEFKGDTWFSSGYRGNWGTAPLSYRDYAKIVTQHYKDEPTILGWSMVNEADTSARDDQGRSVLVNFATDMANLIHDTDPHHLVTVGTQSNGARGASGPDFGEVYGVPGIDFAEVHDWGYWGNDADPMFGGTNGVPPASSDAICAGDDAPIGCSFAQLKTLNKPLLVGEAGIAGGDSGAQQQRADQLGAKMDAAFAAGASGYLLWRVTSKNTSEYDIDAGSDDPLLGRMAQVAAGLS